MARGTLEDAPTEVGLRISDARVPKLHPVADEFAIPALFEVKISRDDNGEGNAYERHSSLN